MTSQTLFSKVTVISLLFATWINYPQRTSKTSVPKSTTSPNYKQSSTAEMEKYFLKLYKCSTQAKQKESKHSHTHKKTSITISNIFQDYNPTKRFKIYYSLNAQKKTHSSSSKKTKGKCSATKRKKQQSKHSPALLQNKSKI